MITIRNAKQLLTNISHIEALLEAGSSDDSTEIDELLEITKTIGILEDMIAIDDLQVDSEAILAKVFQTHKKSLKLD